MRRLDKQEEQSENMLRSYFDHPSVEVLERFALSRSSEQETELLETHMLACESCVCALENVELEIAATKLAMKQFAAERPERTLEVEREKPGFWKSWFSVPTLSWAGAGLAACAFCLFAFVPAGVELKADRDMTNIVVPQWRNAHLRLMDEGLPTGPVKAEIVNQTGALVWSVIARSAQGEVKLEVPRITESGRYYARLYAPGTEKELLDEFPFEVKFQF